MTTRFASGRYAVGFCDVCGFRFKLTTLKSQVVKGIRTNILACPSCWDRDHPQLFLGTVPVFDPQALLNPRTDTSLVVSRDITSSLVTENWQFLLTESGEQITTEGQWVESP